MPFTACLNTVKDPWRVKKCINHDGSCCCLNRRSTGSAGMRAVGLGLRHANVAFGLRSECDRSSWEWVEDMQGTLLLCVISSSFLSPISFEVNLNSTTESIQTCLLDDVVGPCAFLYLSFLPACSLRPRTQTQTINDWPGEVFNQQLVGLMHY